MAYWLLADLEARLSAETVRQIMDDDADGTSDSAPVARLQADSDSKVESYLRGIYDLAAVRAAPPNEVKRLSLDVAVAMACSRHAEYVRRDGSALMKAAEADLMLLRTGKTRLDVVSTPEPAANQGGTVIESELLADEDEPRLFDFGSTGDF